jgi:hypothetical protein
MNLWKRQAINICYVIETAYAALLQFLFPFQICNMKRDRRCSQFRVILANNGAIVCPISLIRAWQGMFRSLVIDGNMGLQLLFALLAVRTCHISYLGGWEETTQLLHWKKKNNGGKTNSIYPKVGAIEHSGLLHFTSAYSNWMKGKTQGDQNVIDPQKQLKTHGNRIFFTKIRRKIQVAWYFLGALGIY